MSILRRLRAMAEALPPGASVNLPADWLLSELERESEGRATAPDTLADLTVEQLAEELGRSGSTVRGWLSAGEFPSAFKLQGREWRIPRSDVVAFLDRQRPKVAKEEQPKRRKVAGSDDLGSWRQHRRGAA